MSAPRRIRSSCGGEQPTPSGTCDASRRGSAALRASIARRRSSERLERRRGRVDARPDRRLERARRPAARRRPHVAPPDGQRLHVRRLRRGPELGAGVESDDRHLHRGAVRPQPLLLGSHPAPRRPHADRRRATSEPTTASQTRRSSIHDANLHPSAGHAVRAGIRPRRQMPNGKVFALAGDNIVQDRPAQTRHSPTPPSIRSRRSSTRDEHLADLTSSDHVPALPVHLPALGRPDDQCWPRQANRISLRPPGRGRPHNEPVRRHSAVMYRPTRS